MITTTYQSYSWHYTGGTERCSDSQDCSTCTDKNCGQASNTGYFKSGTNAQLFCNRNAITCPAGKYLIKNTEVLTRDDECQTCLDGQCKESDGPGACMTDTTTCGQGEQISALDVQVQGFIHRALPRLRRVQEVANTAKHQTFNLRAAGSSPAIVSLR